RPADAPASTAVHAPTRRHSARSISVTSFAVPTLRACSQAPACERGHVRDRTREARQIGHGCEDMRVDLVAQIPTRAGRRVAKRRTVVRAGVSWGSTMRAGLAFATMGILLACAPSKPALERRPPALAPPDPNVPSATEPSPVSAPLDRDGSAAPAEPPL